MVKIPILAINTDTSEGLCFCCGQNNPIGLKLKFERDDNGVRTEFTPAEHHQGWPGILHGGIISCLLDEAMSYAAQFAGLKCITAKMEIRIRRPALITRSLIVTGRIIKHTRRLLDAEASLSLSDGTLVAEAIAKQYVIGDCGAS